jgi:hypothetical protein
MRMQARCALGHAEEQAESAVDVQNAEAAGRVHERVSGGRSGGDPRPAEQRSMSAGLRRASDKQTFSKGHQQF